MKTLMILFPNLVLAFGLFLTPSVMGFIDIDVNIGTSKEPAREIDVFEGQEFTIDLPTVQREGYIWQLEKSPGDNVRLMSVNRGDPKAQGQCPEERWHFQAIDEGKETLRFRLAKPGDPDHPLDRVVYRIDVHD